MLTHRPMCVLILIFQVTTVFNTVVYRINYVIFCHFLLGLKYIFHSNGHKIHYLRSFEIKV